MAQQLSRETLSTLLEAERIEELSLARLIQLVQEEEGLAEYAPDGICQIDPRTGDRILYNSARSRRPHDNRPAESPEETSSKPCVVCQGHTTGVIDVAELSQGFTFINKNLFPALYPSASHNATPKSDSKEPGPTGQPAHGFHLLQWTSSFHERDWHNMPLADRVIVMERLAALEKKLLSASGGEQGEPAGYVNITKNYGRLVGGSLVHGHQQIGFSNVMPRRFADNHRFWQERGESFSAYLQRENPPDLRLKDYGPAVLVVPYFMRRPFDMLLLMKDTSKRHLHELSQAELTAAAQGWHEAINIILKIMPTLGRETAYNVVTHTGPGAGLYFEFLPYTQEMGGFEHLGLLVCQGNPQNIAQKIRQLLAE